MKMILTTLAVPVLFCSVTFAGEAKVPVEPMVAPPPSGCACFDGGFEFSGFGGGFLPDHSAGEAMGGGVSLGYFFNEYIGVEFSYSAYDTEPSEEHVVTGNLVFRYPMEESCIAPYLLVGGGLLTNSETDGFFGAGGGVDIRFESWGCVGIFADGTYNWGQNDEEFTLIRAGVRIPF